MKKILSKKGGFTLIELLVVIAIIAILTAIVTANFSQSKAKARDSKRISDIAQIQLALALFFDRCNAYPDKDNTGSIDLNYQCPTISTVHLYDYISKIPTPPIGGSRNETVYFYEKQGSDYLLMSNLELLSPVLNDDIDGSVVPPFDSFSCEDNYAGNHYYCVKPN